MSEIVGKIEGFDVLYIPEKDVLFCKNTTVPYKHMKQLLIDREVDRAEIKNEMMATIDSNIVTLGCLTTSLENCENINKEIKKFKLWQKS